MSRTGPPHYHQGSHNICHCAFSEVYHTSAPYVYPQPPRPRPIAGHPSEYVAAVRRVPKPKPTNKISKSREMKFDQDTEQWYFETQETPGVRWLDSVRHIEDLPQAKDPEFVSMLMEYYLSGHVIDPPDQEKLPVFPGGPDKTWRYKRAPPPSPVEKQPPSPHHPPPSSHYPSWIEPVYHHQPAAPAYASGSAHPVSMRIPSGVHQMHSDGWRTHSSGPSHDYHTSGYAPHRLGPLPGAPGPRRYIDASVHQQYYADRPPAAAPQSDGDEYDDEDEYDGATTSAYYESEDPRARAYIPPPSPKSRKRAQKLRERGYRVVDPHTNVGESPW